MHSCANARTSGHFLYGWRETATGMRTAQRPDNLCKARHRQGARDQAAGGVTVSPGCKESRRERGTRSEESRERGATAGGAEPQPQAPRHERRKDHVPAWGAGQWQPELVLPRGGPSPVPGGVQGLADELHVVIQQLLHDVGPHDVQMGKVARRPQQDGLESLKYQQHLRGGSDTLRTFSFLPPRPALSQPCTQDKASQALS